MPLQLLPMEESDLLAYREICWLAFKDDLMGIMYPNGYTEAAREWSQKQALEDWREHPDKMKFMKVVDTDLPDDDPNKKIVGIANWKFYLHDRTEEELQEERKQAEERGFPPDSNHALIEEFFGNIAKYKQKNVGGRAYVLLNMLATHPGHHRRGVGAIHLRWGNEQADSLGLPCYLEASPKGKPLYLREGYEVICDFPFDARDWGSDEELPHVLLRARGRHILKTVGELGKSKNKIDTAARLALMQSATGEEIAKHPTQGAPDADSSTPAEPANYIPPYYPTAALFDRTTTWTGRPALDLLHGPDFQYSVADASTTFSKILNELRRDTMFIQGLITEGRTMDYRRFEFDLNEWSAKHPFHKSLAKCVTVEENGRRKKLRFALDALEEELFYLVAWYRHAFPELRSNEHYSPMYPPLLCGSKTSMFEVLAAEGLAVEALELSNPDRCARMIFMTLITHVSKNTYDSPLFHASAVPLNSPLHIQNGRIVSISDTLTRSRQHGCDEVLAIPDRLLTLAPIPENFYTALVYTMEAHPAKPSKTEEGLKDAVEALMYRLAVKDPTAFPNVFSVLGGSTGATKAI